MLAMNVKQWTESALGRAGRGLRLAAIALAAMHGSAAANTDWANSGSAAWGSGSNWSSGNIPGASADVFIEDGGTATVNATRAAKSLVIGGNDGSYNGNGTLSLSSGAVVTVTNGLRFGPTSAPNESGTLNINGGVLNLSGSGTSTGSHLATATLNLTAGTLDLAGGNIAAGIAQFNFSGGVLQDAGTVSSNINLSGGTILTTTANTTINGTVTSTGLLTKIGGASLTLGGSNSYSGGTTLSQGVLVATNAASLGAPIGALSINSATLEIAGGFSEGRNINLTNNNATIQVDAGTYSNSGRISTPTGTGSLNKTGPGTLDLAGTVNVAGHVNATAGLLQVDGSLTAAAMNINGSAQLAGAGAISTTADNLYYNSVAPGKFAGSIVSGSQGLEIVSGALTLTGSNTLAGPTNIDAATSLLVAGAANTLSPNSAVVITGGTLDASAYPQTIQSLTMSGGLLNVSVGHLLTSASTAGFGGALNVLGFSSGTAELASYSSETGTFGSVTGLPSVYQLAYLPNQLDVVVGGSATWGTALSGSWTSSANWCNGAVPSGSGAQAVVAAAATASCTITLDSPQTLGTLTFTNSAGGAAGATLAPGASGSLTMNNSGSDAQIIVAGGTHAISAAVEIAGGNLDVLASGSGTLTISGNITDDGGSRSLLLGGDGSGELILSGTNSFTGGTVVTAGTLVLNSDEGLADGTSLTVGDPSEFGGNEFDGQPVATAGHLGAQSSGDSSPEITAVPEPGTVALFAALWSAIACYRFSKRRRPQ